ncbi:filamentous haemagglutinin family protein [Achromobacter xylosoxidans]|uniref:filamentous haemagglutinin family protein n=1 Tax=Alcaligenes xylosoxydans xylosoxydans TaxID=85698 RepID=UPI001FF2179C|nr:filamentous haemagglutinin family protein [Achromobacter xylosoxidans]
MTSPSRKFPLARSAAASPWRGRLKPVPAALLLMLAAGGAQAAPAAFSSGWFAAKGATQAQTQATGRAPDGSIAGVPTAARQQAQARQQLQHSLTNLNRTAAAIAAQQAAQAAARQAAGGAAPDGLVEGGLKVDTQALTRGWLNAQAPVASVADGRTTVTVTQTADRAILNWETFNVGRNTTVDFRQQAEWAVLNRINDPAGRPSQIQGQVKGQGTVLLVNRNGVVFDGGSQVNVRNLVAAAGRISDEQFRERGLYGAQGTTATFTDALGRIDVRPGARIDTHAPASVTQGGGYVLLAGSEVHNAGAITTPRGQAQLAAGDSFVIRRGVGTQDNTLSTTRGNEIAPRQGATGGLVRNTGLITAAEGDVTLAGREVRQEGVALATTTTRTRGTIHLLNSAADTQGSIVLGAQSVTAVLIDDDGSSALDSQRSALIKESAEQDLLRQRAAFGVFDNLSRLSDRRDQSRIEIVSGGDIQFQGGALALATGGQIAASATRRSFVADGAELDVAGLVGARISMESNSVKVNVQGNELRDAPGNRDAGKLFNGDVWIDRRSLIKVAAGTGGYEGERWYTAGGLLEVGGYLGNLGHGIGEWAAQGGTVTLGGKEVVAQAGARINLAGGTLDVAEGSVNLSWLRGADGRLYEASTAPADVLYSGIYKGYEDRHQRWGESATRYFDNPLLAPRTRLEAGYTVGRDAGQLLLSAPTAVLESEIVATVYDGVRQTRAREAAADGYQQGHLAVARAGTLASGRYGALGRIDVYATDVRLGRHGGITAGMAADDALDAARIGTLWLDAATLSARGLGRLDLATAGTLTVADAVALADGGRVALTAGRIDVGAGLAARGGAISLSNTFVSPDASAKPRALSTAGAAAIVLRDGAVLDASGRWVDLRRQEGATPQLGRLDGGSVTLASPHAITLERGALIDVSSGGALLQKGATRGGKGGDVSLRAGTPEVEGAANGALAMDAQLRGYGMTGGGTLTIERDGVVQIGGAREAAADGALWLDPAMLRTGFSHYDINGRGGLRVAPGAVLAVAAPVYRYGAPGADAAALPELWLPPEYQDDPVKARLTPRAGADLTLRSQRIEDGADIVIGAGAQVMVDPGRAIRLLGGGNSRITVDGTLRARGGRIEADIVAPDSDRRDSPASKAHNRAIWIGDGAVLDVSGQAAGALDAQGLRYGKAPAGGSILLGGALDWDASGAAPAARDLAIVIRPGALLDASGSRIAIDAARGNGLGARDLAGDGGQIVLKTTYGLFLDGEMRASAGGARAAGGTLALALETPTFPLSVSVDDAVRGVRELILSQTTQSSGLAANLSPGQADPALRHGAARLSVEQFEAGGFGNLSLLVNGILGFDGKVSLSASQSLRIYAGSYAVTDRAPADVAVSLAAPYLRLAGASRARGDGVTPTVGWRDGPSTRAGIGTFTASADLIDVRDRVGFGALGAIRMADGSAVQVDRRGFDQVRLDSRGDVRLLGGQTGRGLSGDASTELGTVGDLRITSAQLYPATGASATIWAGYAPGRRLEILRQAGTDAAPPLSVFGKLSLSADTVIQAGTIRAPMGEIMLGQDALHVDGARAASVELMPGSLTSVSGAGVMVPYGGTADGLAYTYAGKALEMRQQNAGGIEFTSRALTGYAGAALDLGGGGDLRGAAFVTGRGGSVDILRTPLVNANPVFRHSAAGNRVYAIVPGYAGQYAPVAPDTAGNEPEVGQTLTLAQDAGGLKAGVYTLMPAAYALMPGAYRVELGAETLAPGAAPTPQGSLVASGYLGVANTGLRAALPRQLLLTPGDQVRKHSGYNEMSHDAFVAADAQRRGGLRGQIAADARTLRLSYGRSVAQDGKPMLAFDGSANFAAAKGGTDGTLEVSGTGIELLADGVGPTAGYSGASLSASALNRFNPVRMLIGGTVSLRPGDNFATFQSTTNTVDLRAGATLRAAEVFLVSGATWGGITVEEGASISTIGRGKPAYDSSSGLVYAAGMTGVLGVSNGWVNLLPANPNGTQGPGYINVGACAGACTGAATTLAGEGTLLIATDKVFTLADNARYGARNLLLAMSALNLGDAAALAQAAAQGVLPSGLAMNQGVLDRLLKGNAGPGIPVVETLVLNARDSVNVFGSVTLDTSGGKGVGRLVLGAPAIYGYGGAGDTAVIRSRDLVWTGISARPLSQTGEYDPSMPGAAIADRLGDGRLQLAAERIVFGYGPESQPLNWLSADRLALGFAGVDLLGSASVGANGLGTLKAYHRQGAYEAGKGYAYRGGDLNIVTPLLTGDAASSLTLAAGGALTLRRPDGAPVQPANAGALGAKLALEAGSVDLDGTIVLASGKLTVKARDDLRLGAQSRLDLSGREVGFYEQLGYTWGGDLVLESAAGNIEQAAGAVIDLSARHQRGGTLAATALGATAGRVNLAGSILGGASGQYDAGGTRVPYDGAEITVRAQALADFAGLNARLNQGQVFGARRFQTKQGDLTVGDEVRARQVAITVDGGNLTVAGRIDASGFQPGVIRLAANGDLTVLGTLDTHGAGLRRDSYGKIIDSPNRALVSLTSRNGTLILGPAAAIDLRAGTEAEGHDGVARGTLDLNARRIGGAGPRGDGAGANDVALRVQGAPRVRGAATVAVNAFREYADAPLADTPDVSGSKPQLITQDMLIRIDGDSQTFINAALGNGALRARLAGLDGYRLRPGVDIVSDPLVNPAGNLTVAGDLDLSGFRYGPGADRLDPARRGFGEPGVLNIRAAGDLTLHGSINDGFAPPPATPDDQGWYLVEWRTNLGDGTTPFGSDVVIPIDGVSLDKGTVFPRHAVLNYDLPADGMALPKGVALPVMAELAGSYVLPAGMVLAADVYYGDGSLAWRAGTVPTADITLSPGMKLGAGTVLRAETLVAALTWPKGVALPVAMTASGVVPLARGAVIPALTKVELPGDKPIDLRPKTGEFQGANWALAPMLPQGATSWSLQLTAGADLGSADPRAVDPASRGSLVLADSHSSSRLKVTPGGVGMVYAPNDYGYPEGEPVDPDWVSDCDILPGLCVIDPKRISLVWGPAAYDIIGEVEGTPVLEGMEGVCDLVPGMCKTEIAPIKDIVASKLLAPMFSVVRTGAADLGLTAAGDLRMPSPYGVYTAGTPSAALLRADGVDPYDQPRGKHVFDATGGSERVSLLGPQEGDYAAANGSYRAWYPEHGGNLDIAVGGGISGDLWSGLRAPERAQTANASVGNWLWRQGSDALPASWWINFGAYAVPMGVTEANGNEPYLVGFTGFGTLGGGNLSLRAGGDAGVMATRPADIYGARPPRSQGLAVAVGSTGRVGADGGLTLTGGGDLTVRLGGAWNPDFDATQHATQYMTNSQKPDLDGMVTNLRGTIQIAASAIGGARPLYRKHFLQQPGLEGDALDARTIDPFMPTLAAASGGITLVPGDAGVYLETLGDLVLSGVSDAGRVRTLNTSVQSPGAALTAGGGQSWFTLWTPATAINLLSAGGNATPSTAQAYLPEASLSVINGDGVTVYPSILRVTAASGSIYFGRSIRSGNPDAASRGGLLLAPSASGELSFLARQSIYGGGSPVSMSGADTALPTPFQPAYAGFDASGAVQAGKHNLGIDASAPFGPDVPVSPTSNWHPLFAFGPDTPGVRPLHAEGGAPARFYAVRGDLVGLSPGMAADFGPQSNRTILHWLRAATPVRALAGRDIVALDGTFLHNGPSDVSLLRAGRDIWYADVKVAGPGLLDVIAGRNLLQEDRASIVSVGPALRGDRQPGASIAITAGAGAAGPDYDALARLYLDPANRALAGQTLSGQPGKVVHTYERELADWLRSQDGFSGSDAEVLARFEAMPLALRQGFLRSVYFAELRAGGREYNDAQGPRPGSYLRGRQAIAALFPEGAAREGGIAMSGASGVRTVAGGSIQLLAPGGQIVVGVPGIAPPGSAGLITQGQGDIQVYSQGSLLLGLSRVMTTFGGDILAWSAEGDINAGRGAKTTVVYTPPRREYDAMGNVVMAPQAPSSGAGIATLNPIPEVPRGDIDLIAPLGTIDPGEAGVRSSGNVNVAALHVVNAANIQAQGSSAGVPAAAAVNTGALSSASAASSAAAASAENDAARTRSASRQSQPSIISVQILGYGNEPAPGEGAAPAAPAGASAVYDPASAVRVLGLGELPAQARQQLTERERDNLGPL